MIDSEGRRRENSLSGVAASAVGVAAQAAQAAGSAFEIASRKMDEARDRVARRRDPKTVHIRLVRAARRRTTGWVSSTSAAASVSAIGFAAAAPDVGVVAVGVAAALAVPTTIAARRFRRLHHAPVPPRGYARRDLPRAGSASYPAARRLADAEQEFLALMAVLARSRALPPDVVSELDDGADSSAEAIVAYAVQLQGLESVARGTDSALRGALDAGLRRLDEGVVAYLDMVRSAAGTVAAAHDTALGAAPDALSRSTPLLRDNAERLQAWAYGISVLPRVPDSHTW